MAEPLIRRECFFCGRAFWAYRTDAKYCSGRCRQRAMRWRAKLQTAEARAIGALAEVASYIDYEDSRPSGVHALLRLQQKVADLLIKHGVQKVK